MADNDKDNKSLSDDIKNKAEDVKDSVKETLHMDNRQQKKFVNWLIVGIFVVGGAMLFFGANSHNSATAQDRTTIDRDGGQSIGDRVKRGYEDLKDEITGDDNDKSGPAKGSAVDNRRANEAAVNKRVNKNAGDANN